MSHRSRRLFLFLHMITVSTIYILTSTVYTSSAVGLEYFFSGETWLASMMRSVYVGMKHPRKRTPEIGSNGFLERGRFDQQRPAAIYCTIKRLDRVFFVFVPSSSKPSLSFLSLSPSLPLFLSLHPGGFAQDKYGGGQLDAPVVAAVFVVFYPELSIFVGICQV